MSEPRLPFLARAGAAYAPLRAPDGALRLDGNTGAPPAVDLTEAAVRALDNLERYPDTSALAARLAERLGVPADEVLVTAGADDALDRACRLALADGGKAVIPTPAFEMTLRYARRTGGRVIEVPWTDAFPERALLDAIDDDVRLVVLTSPNNPCGRLVPPEVLARIAARAPQALLVVDEAYAEYASRTLFPEARALPHAIVVRTLSKAWGLAALRTGYVVGARAILDGLRAVGSPYAVAGPSVALAGAVLDAGDASMRAHVARTARARARLTDTLTRLGCTVTESEASFVLVDVAGAVRDGAQVLAALLRSLGVIVRTFADRPELVNRVRISVPEDEGDLTRLEAALEAALAPAAVLFDMDGVLADVSASYRAAIAATAARFGVTVTGDDIAREKAVGDANDDWALTYRLIVARGGAATLEEVTCAFESLYQGTPDAPGLFRTERALFARDELARLGVRARLGVVTGRPRRDAERFLADTGQAGVFATVVAREDAPLKPARDPVELAQRRLGAASAWMIGDTVDDVRAARGARAVPIGVIPPGDPRPDETRRALLAAGAALVLDTPTDILELVP